jgi:hypothetical protein
MASEAIFHPPTGSVQFAIYPDGMDGARIIARIDEEALLGRFHATEHCDSDLVQAYARNADSIDAMATARYRQNPALAVCLGSQDFQRESIQAEASPAAPGASSISISASTQLVAT